VADDPDPFQALYFQVVDFLEGDSTYFGRPVANCLPVESVVSSRHLAGILLFSAIAIEYSWLGVADAPSARHSLFMASMCLAKRVRPYHFLRGPGLTPMQSIDWTIQRQDYSDGPERTAIKSAFWAFQALRRLIHERDTAAARADVQDYRADQERRDRIAL